MAYTVYSAQAFYPHCGELTVYAAVSPKNVKTVLAQIDDEISRLLHDGISEEEYRMTKAQLKGGFILGQESAYHRMNGLGSNLALLDRFIPAEETIRSIEDVTYEDVMRVAERILSAERSQAFVGKKIDKLIK